MSFLLDGSRRAAKNSRKMMMSHATPFVVVVACFASLVQAQVVSFDTKRCQSGEFRQLGEAYVAFCDGYENGDAACTVWSGARKQSSDACLSGALMRSQMRIREEKSAPPVAKPAATAKAPDRPSPDVCRRTMLAGERYRTWRWGRRDRSVCVVCEPTVRDGGAVRVVDGFESVRVTGLIQHVKRVA